MIMTLAEFRRRSGIPDTQMSDEEAEAKLHAAEYVVRNHTNNSFAIRDPMTAAVCYGSTIVVSTDNEIKAGDTLLLRDTLYNDGVIDVIAVASNGDGTINVTVNRELHGYDNGLMYRVVYPDDIKEGVCGMLRYDAKGRAKQGVQQETIGRHSVTYVDQSGEQSKGGYPDHVMSFLRPHIKARFGW